LDAHQTHGQLLAFISFHQRLAEIKISPASPEDAPIPIKATFVPD
jgi:hypothetical protein